MPVSRSEQWVQIAELDGNDSIHFTAAYRDIMGELGWEAKAFAGHLLGLWYDPFEHMLDYTTGEATLTEDQPGLYDRNDPNGPQDVVEYWAEIWSKCGKFQEPAQNAGTGLGLGIDWYRDILRAKLVSMRIPKRLLLAYRDKLQERLDAFDCDESSD